MTGWIAMYRWLTFDLMNVQPGVAPIRRRSLDTFNQWHTCPAGEDGQVGLHTTIPQSLR